MRRISASRTCERISSMTRISFSFLLSHCLVFFSSNMDRNIWEVHLGRRRGSKQSEQAPSPPAPTVLQERLCKSCILIILSFPVMLYRTVRKIFKFKGSPVCFKGKQGTAPFTKPVKSPAGCTFVNHPYHISPQRSLKRAS